MLVGCFIYLQMYKVPSGLKCGDIYPLYPSFLTKYSTSSIHIILNSLSFDLVVPTTSYSPYSTLHDVNILQIAIVVTLVW